MDKTDLFADLTNKQMLCQLRTHRVVGMLEELLGDKILPDLKMQEELALDLGERVTRDSVDEYFPSIKRSVDDLLEVKGPSPKIWIQTYKDARFWKYLCEMTFAGAFLGYIWTALCTQDFLPSLASLKVGESIALTLSTFSTLIGSPNFYRTDDKDISLRKSKIAIARGVMAHEYVHAVQDSVGMPMFPKFSYLTEGMAERIRMIVGEDDSVRYEDLRSHFFNIQNAYRLLATKVGRKVNSDLVKKGQPFVPLFCKCYAYGDAFCYLQELDHGSGFYREIAGRASVLKCD